MNPVYILVEAKKEYTSQLQKILTPRLYEGFKSIYEDILQLLSSEVEEKNIQSSSTIKTFQKMLREIPQWNQEIIKKEFSRIEKISNCDYFEDLLEAIFITNTKILTSVQINDTKSKNIKINIPQGCHFIHKCYMECAKEIYKNPYIYDQSKILTPKEKHNNLREALSLIELSINNAIRDLLPIRDILRQGITKFNNDASLFEEKSSLEEVTNNYENSDEIEQQLEEESEQTMEETMEETLEQNLEFEKEPSNINLSQLNPNSALMEIEKENSVDSSESEEIINKELKLQKIVDELSLKSEISLDINNSQLNSETREDLKQIILAPESKKIISLVEENINQSSPVENMHEIQTNHSIFSDNIPKSMLEIESSENIRSISPPIINKSDVHHTILDQAVSLSEQVLQRSDISDKSSTQTEFPKSKKIIILNNSSTKSKNAFTPFIKEIKSKNFLKNKSINSDKNTLFYKKKYEENSANYNSVSDLKPSLTNLSELTKEKIITKNKIMLEDNSSDEENDEIILD